MRQKRLAGWLLVILGLFLMLLPFISSSTGFFITGFATNPQPPPVRFELNMFLLIPGTVLVVVGYFLLRSTEKPKFIREFK